MRDPYCSDVPGFMETFDQQLNPDLDPTDTLKNSKIYVNYRGDDGKVHYSQLKVFIERLRKKKYGDKKRLAWEVPEFRNLFWEGLNPDINLEKLPCTSKTKITYMDPFTFELLTNSVAHICHRYAGTLRPNPFENEYYALSDPMFQEIFKANRHLNSIAFTDLARKSKRRVWFRNSKGGIESMVVKDLLEIKGVSCCFKDGIKQIPPKVMDFPDFNDVYVSNDKGLSREQIDRLPYNSKTRLTIQCMKGHRFPATVKQALLKPIEELCPYCRGDRAIPGETDAATADKELVWFWDEDRNNEQLSMLLPTCSRRFYFYCPYCGYTFREKLCHMVNAERKCPDCSGTGIPGINLEECPTNNIHLIKERPLTMEEALKIGPDIDKPKRRRIIGEI